MRSVFLSYPHRDRAVAQEIKKELGLLGMPAFDLANEVSTGDSLRTTLRHAIERADALVLLIASPAAAAASWVGYEAGMADALGKRIILLLSQDHATDELPADMATWRVIQFDPKRPDHVARGILEELAPA